MIQSQTQGEAVRQAFLKFLSLSRGNRQIADRYLDMENPEEEEILKGIEHQDLSQISHYLGEDADYPDWLRKKKRTEELKRYLRFLVELGGSTACELLVRFSPMAEMSTLMRVLPLLTGPHAEEQKLAVQAGFCTIALLRMRPGDVKTLCKAHAGDPEIFLRAQEYCYDVERKPGAGAWSRSRMLLQAMYLHHKAAGSAQETASELEGSLIRAIAGLMAFEKRELTCIQDFARTAGRDTPFPQRILSIYQERKSGINPSLIAGCAFFALEHSVRFEILLRLMAAVDCRFQGRNLALETCMGITEADWFDAHMEQIEDMLPILDEDYILWCLKIGYRAGAGRMARNCPEGIRAAAEKADVRWFEELMETVSEAAPELYREMEASREETFREKLASEMVHRVYPGKADAKEYLLGKCSVDRLLPYMKEWGYDFYLDEDLCEDIEILKRRPDEGMYRRAVILEALKKVPDYFSEYPVFGETDEAPDHKELMFDGRQIRGLLRIFETEQVPFFIQMEALGGMSQSMSGRAKKELLLDRYVEILAAKMEGKSAEDQETEKVLREGSAEACCLCLKMLHAYGGGRYREQYLACASHSSKKVRELLLVICRPYPEWKPQILDMLGSKKLREREFAAGLLEEWEDPSCLQELKAAGAREKNQKLAVRLENLIEFLEQKAAGREETSNRAEERLAAEIFRGNRKRKVEWVQGLSLPEVRRKDGETVTSDYLSAILVSYADMDPLGIHPDAVKLAEVLDPEELSAYVLALYEGWLSAGAEAKKRWVLYAVSVHGGARMVPLLKSQIQDWVEHQRGAMAAETVQALALNSSPKALALVDQMSRKGKSRQVRNAAKAALQNAASALGIRREELEDRLVPDVSVEELTKKEIREIRSGQKTRLEQALSSARLWDTEQWRALFLAKPVMLPYATGLIWGVYEEQRCLASFRYMEDGTFNTAEGEAYTLPENGRIGLVHPLELTEEERKAWEEQLSDYEIEQPFEQLARTVYRVTEEEQKAEAVSRFEDRMLNGLALSRRLLSMGWIRGEILDAGFYESYYHADGEFGAELAFSGSSVGYEDGEVTAGNVYFYHMTETDPGSVTYRAFQKEERCRPGEVPERYFSEVLRQIGKALGI